MHPEIIGLCFIPHLNLFYLSLQKGLHHNLTNLLLLGDPCEVQKTEFVDYLAQGAPNLWATAHYRAAAY